MRIASLSHSFPKLSESFVHNQIIGLLEAGEEVDVFSESVPETEADDGVISDYGLAQRTTYTCDPATYVDGLRILLRSFPRLLARRSVPSSRVFGELARGTSAPRRLCNLEAVTRTEEYDVYHAHFGTVGNSFLGLSTVMDRPFVVSFYGWDASQKLQEDPHCYDELFEQADAVTVLSEHMRSIITDAGCPRKKTYIQPLCIDTSKFSFRPSKRDGNEPIRILTVARFVEKKGLEYALRAVAEISDSYDVEYSIAGDGENRAKIERLISELGIDDSVSLLGWQPQAEIAKLMHDTHLFVLPSVTAENGDKEGTPTVLLEAQSRGIPVVSTFHAGIPEIVDDGRSGKLVPERDSAALADAIRELVDRSDEWPQMGRHGRQCIESTHSIEMAVRNLHNLYNSIR